MTTSSLLFARVSSRARVRVRANIKKKIADKLITEDMLDAEELAADAPALEVDDVLDMT